ncbi:MAG TPA: MogA/MoaB family molybdenum cofactor biosynthesis protein [Candidatus Limnocylindrales bacterium]|nr:MogA/MoaB family molybdenum cofactor biosynthesis protein [Candidatus Limnocylindrales bacterium]
MSDGPPPARTVLVLTTSDRSAAGTRDDTSGAVLADRLTALGFVVERAVVADDREEIEQALRDASDIHPLIVTTGGTGLTPRDVTPQATLAVIDYEVPGLAEAIRAEGRTKTPFAALSRAVVGVRGHTLIVNTPGSPKGAAESLEAIVPVLDHALETLAGPHDHAARSAGAVATSLDPDGDAPADSTEDQHAFGRREAPSSEPEEAD